MTFDRSVLDRLINLENPVLDYLYVAEEYMKINQYTAAFTYYMKCAEATDPESDFNIRYHCLCSISYIYWTLGNRWRGAIQYARLAKAECPDRPEAYYLLSLELSYFLYADNEYEQGRWSEVYENSKIGALFAKANPQPNSRYYHGLDGLLVKYAEALLRINRMDEAKEVMQMKDYSSLTYQFDIECRDFMYNELHITPKLPFSLEEFFNSTEKKNFLELRSGNILFNSEPLEDAGWQGTAVSTSIDDTNKFNLQRQSKCIYSEELIRGYEDILGDHNLISKIGALIIPELNVYLNSDLHDYKFERIYSIVDADLELAGYEKVAPNCWKLK